MRAKMRENEGEERKGGQSQKVRCIVAQTGVSLCPFACAPPSSMAPSRPVPLPPSPLPSAVSGPPAPSVAAPSASQTIRKGRPRASIRATAVHGSSGPHATELPGGGSHWDGVDATHAAKRSSYASGGRDEDNMRARATSVAASRKATQQKPSMWAHPGNKQLLSARLICT